MRHPAVRLEVDPIACDGVGLCMHLASGIIRPDSWGFPIVAGSALTRRDLAAARAAARACPRRALHLRTG